MESWCIKSSPSIHNFILKEYFLENVLRCRFLLSLSIKLFNLMINHSNYTATSSPSVNGHVTLSEPLHARHLIARGHSTQIHQYVILRHHQVQRANNVPKAKKSLNVHFPRININKFQKNIIACRENSYQIIIKFYLNRFSITYS